MDYDLIKERINTAIENADADVCTDTGTITSLVVGGCAAPIAGCYGLGEEVGRKPFVDVCNRVDLEHHAVIKQVPFTADIEDEDLRKRVLDRFRIPPTGGSGGDWTDWVETALGSSGVKSKILNCARGQATVDVVLGHNGASMLSAVTLYIDGKRPWGLADTQISVASKREIGIRITYKGDGVDTDAVKNAILNEYGLSGRHLPATDLYRSRVESIAVGFGAENADMSWTESVMSGIYTPGSCTCVVRFGIGAYPKLARYEHLVVTDVVCVRGI